MAVQHIVTYFKNFFKEEITMFKMKKLAAVAAAAVMAVSAMAINASATKVNWTINSFGNSSASGIVSGLVQGRDTGVTFECFGYSDPINNNFYVRCTVPNSNLCLYQNDSVILSYAGDSGTVLFQNNWYRYSNGGNAPFMAVPNGLVSASGQYMNGIAK